MGWIVAFNESEGYSETVTNTPQGRSSVSLFAHHGELDDVVLPGAQNDTSGREIGTHVSDLYALSGMAAAEIPLRKTSLKHLASAKRSSTAIRSWNTPTSPVPGRTGTSPPPRFGTSSSSIRGCRFESRLIGSTHFRAGGATCAAPH
jgi:hypothetical protein